MNRVEHFFGELTADCIRDGSFGNVQELVDAIVQYLADRNEDPKRYVWRAKGEELLKKSARAKQALETVTKS